jgi:DNA-binding LytR/AlgR family response regulator
MLEKRHGEVVAVFTDVDMPGDMDGLELAGIVHHRWPDMAILVASIVFRVRADTLPADGVFINKLYST